MLNMCLCVSLVILMIILNVSVCFVFACLSYCRCSVHAVQCALLLFGLLVCPLHALTVNLCCVLRCVVGLCCLFVESIIILYVDVLFVIRVVMDFRVCSSICDCVCFLMFCLVKTKGCVAIRGHVHSYRHNHTRVTYIG